MTIKKSRRISHANKSTRNRGETWKTFLAKRSAEVHWRQSCLHIIISMHLFLYRMPFSPLGAGNQLHNTPSTIIIQQIPAGSDKGQTGDRVGHAGHTHRTPVGRSGDVGGGCRNGAERIPVEQHFHIFCRNAVGKSECTTMFMYTFSDSILMKMQARHPRSMHCTGSRPNTGRL